MQYQSESTINTAHTAQIHDLKFDYYAKLLASCSTDGYVHIYQSNNLISQFKVGDSPLWTLDWAHPRFGMLLAVSSFDGEISIWKGGKEWQKVFSNKVHQGSANKVQWCGSELKLLSCGSDGTVAIHTSNNDWKNTQVWNAHDQAVHSVSWNDDNELIATGSSDKSVKIWKNKEQLARCEGHKELVRDVEWHPLKSVLASGSQDGSVIIWDIQEDGEYKMQQQIEFNVPVWRVRWSLCGDKLVVSMSGEENTESTLAVLQEQEDGSYQVIQTQFDKP